MSAGDDLPWPSARRAWWAVVVLMLTYMVALIDRQILSLLVGPLKSALALSDSQLGLLQGLAFGVFYTLLGVPIGRVIDMTSRRNVLAVGCFLWCCMTAVCGLANSFPQLFLARVGVGVGEATMSPGALSMLTDYLAPDRRPLAVSVYVAGGSLGSGLALIAGGAVIEHFTRLGHVTLPLLGTLEPWQCVFVLIGTAGLTAVLLLLTLREPARRGLGAAASERPDPRTLLDFVRQRRQLFLCHFSGFALFSTLCYGLLAWAPTFFIRHYGWSTARVGLWFGLMIMCCGVLGVISGGAWATRARRRGVSDATLRTATWGVAAIVLPATLAPLAGDANLSLALYGVATIFVAFPSGVSATALQEVTPNRLRAQVSALYYFAINLVGLGLGPLSVALLTDYIFRREDALGYSLAVCAAVLGPAGALLMKAALGPFRAALSLRSSES